MAQHKAVPTESSILSDLQHFVDALSKLALIFGGGWLALTAIVVVCTSIVIIAVAPAFIGYKIAQLKAYTNIRLRGIINRRKR